MQITEGTCDGETRALVISPNTVGALRLFVPVNLAASLDDSLLLNLPIRLVIGGEFESADLSSTLLGVSELSRSAQHSSRVTNIRRVYAVFNLENGYATCAALPVVLLYFKSAIN